MVTRRRDPCLAPISEVNDAGETGRVAAAAHAGLSHGPIAVVCMPSLILSKASSLKRCCCLSPQLGWDVALKQ